MEMIYEATGLSYVVVGGNSDIGQATIALMLDSGAKVFSIDIQKKSRNKVSDRLQYYYCDPKRDLELQKIGHEIFSLSSSINGLVVLSGTINHFKPVLELSAEEWNDTYNISFLPCFHACKIFTPFLQQSDASAIVNMASGLGFVGQKNYGPYAAAKASIISLTKTLATELGSSCRVNSVSPGAVDTQFILQEDGSSRFDKKIYENITPLGNLAQPVEIASVIMFLLSKAASHITGQSIHVNGGAMML